MAKKTVKKSSKKSGKKKTPVRGKGKKQASAKKTRPAARRPKPAAPKRIITKPSAVKKKTGNIASPKATAKSKVEAVVPSPPSAPPPAPAPAAVLSPQTPAAPAATRDAYADEIDSALTDEPAGDDSEW